MTLPTEVARAAEELLRAMKGTEAFKRYEALRGQVLADEVNRRLLRRYTQAQAALQMAAMAGVEPREADTSEFERLSALLYESDEATDYLLAQMRAQQLVAEVLERLTREVGVSVDIKEA